MRKVLFDINVILGVLFDRKPYVEASASAWAAVETGPAVDGADRIVTRDPKGFRGSPVRCLTPEAVIPLFCKAMTLGLRHTQPAALTPLLVLLASACRKPPPIIVVPEIFRVKFETSQGDFVVEANRDWAPHGVDRFHELVRMRYFDQGRFFRVLPGFIAQFGVHRDFDVHATWRNLFIVDDPPKQKNLRGTLAFAKSGPNTRATEIFINLADNSALDSDGFVPFARVIQGMDVVDKFYSGYGEMRPEGKWIDRARVEEETNEYLVQRFPKLDYIKRTQFQP